MKTDILYWWWWNDDAKNCLCGWTFLGTGRGGDKTCSDLSITVSVSVSVSLSLSLSLCLCFNGYFPSEPGLAGTRMSPLWILLQLNMIDGGSVNNWSYKMCKAPVKSSPPTNQHLMFYRPDALPVTQPTVSKTQSTEGKHYYYYRLPRPTKQCLPSELGNVSRRTFRMMKYFSVKSPFSATGES